MKTKKKNRFLTFCISCIPGGGEMYMGFMKRGLSMMLLFAFTIIISVWLNQGIITFLCVVEWFYSFFYANHLASLSDEDFAQVKDEYLCGADALPIVKGFAEKHNKWLAWLLILLGICFLWSSLTDFLFSILPDQYRYIVWTMRRVGDYVPSVLLGCGIIYLGVKMISGKEMEAASKEEKKEQALTDEIMTDEKQEGK